MAKSVPAIFLDRDGTINVDHGYVHEIDNFYSSLIRHVTLVSHV
ncbi:hypothetical protein ACUOCP_09340, partial [Escherichia sp. R-CC3]